MSPLATLLAVLFLTGTHAFMYFKGKEDGERDMKKLMGLQREDPRV